jgi:hypothetical protein
LAVWGATDFYEIEQKDQASSIEPFLASGIPLIENAGSVRT